MTTDDAKLPEDVIDALRRAVAAGSISPVLVARLVQHFGYQLVDPPGPPVVRCWRHRFTAWSEPYKLTTDFTGLRGQIEKYVTKQNRTCTRCNVQQSRIV